jgi:LCP family protein required for cell wall assembly
VTGGGERVDERADDTDPADPEPREDSPGEPDESDESQPPLAGRRKLVRSVGLGAGRAVLGLASVAVLVIAGYGWWAVGDVAESTVTTEVIDREVAGTRVPLDGAVDILLVGMDSRTDAYGNPLPREVLDMLHAGVYEGERNTDTMILVHIPVDGTRAVAFSFPRDSWVTIAGGFGKHKLNSAFAYAYNDARRDLARTVTDRKQLEAQAAAIGRKNLIATIEDLIGRAVTIDRYAEVNLASFYEITKAIGGVDVCLTAAVDEPKSGASFPKGRQTISGASALAFVRQRYDLPNGDLDRIVRQQVFLGALADKVLSAEMLTSPTMTRELVGAVQRSVVLSNGWELFTFAAQMQGLSSGAIDFYTIPTQGGARIGGADVIRVDPDQVRRFVAGLTGEGLPDPSGEPRFDPEPSVAGPTVTTTTTAPRTSRSTRVEAGGGPPLVRQPSTITVDVRNATATPGLATTVQDRLVQQGFLRGETGDAPVEEVSVVRYASGEQYSAQLVAGALGRPLPLEPDLSLPAGHVRVILGADYPTEAQGFARRGAALRQPVTSSTPLPPSSQPGTPDQARPIVAGRLTCVN